jgi:hypothetical protein
MATISFLAGEAFNINDLAGSGLGFYGPTTFGAAVRVGEYQDNTYITDATGATQGPKVDNVKYVHPQSGQLAGSDTRILQQIPNYLATLNIRFTHTAACQVQNAQVRIFDRSNINAPPSGVTCKVAKLVHPWTGQTPNGSGDTTWSTLGGSGGLINGRTYDLPLTLVNSPGTSGLAPSGTATVDTQHDFYLVMSASPDSIGSKSQFGLYCSLEYF